MLRLWLFALTSILVVGGPVAAAPNETLLVTMPKGWKVGAEKKTDKETLQQWVPAAETVEGWTEMVTVRELPELREMSPAQYRTQLEKLWGGGCPGSSFEKIKDGTEYFYPTVVWVQRCPSNARTGKPEFTWLKAIKGRETFFVVQKAYRFDPNAKQQKVWTRFLDGVRICDTRAPNKACGGKGK